MKYKALTNVFLSEFCMELSMLIHAGVPLSDGIYMLKEDATEKDAKLVMQSLYKKLEVGESLSVALYESNYFPRYMIDMTEVGEKTGNLANTLKALSEHYDRQDRLTLSIKNAVLYPAVLLVMMVAVVLILIIQVLPIFNDVFGRLGTQMSPLAVTLMRFGEWLGNVSAIIATIFSVIIVAAIVIWIMPEIRSGIIREFQNRWGTTSVFGRVVLSRFVSIMALSMSSGLGVEEAVEMAASVSGNSVPARQKSDECIKLLRTGSTLSAAMQESKILSARDSRMLMLGLKSGMMDRAMAEIADRNERNVQDEIDRIVGRIEPALVVLTSAIVGVILLSVMLPLMSIMMSIG